MTHPLDNEEILVTVVVTHLPTGRTGSASVQAPCDQDPSVTQAVEQAGDTALDELLKQLES